MAVAHEPIERSLAISPDISPDLITQLFEEANVALPELVQRRVEEVASFHRELLENRVKRLTIERTALHRRADRIQKDIKKANDEAEALLRYLGSHGAIDEQVPVSARSRRIARMEVRGNLSRPDHCHGLGQQCHGKNGGQPAGGPGGPPGTCTTKAGAGRPSGHKGRSQSISAD